MEVQEALHLVAKDSYQSHVRSEDGRGLDLAYCGARGSLTMTSGGKKRDRDRLKGEKEETGTQVHPQTGGLVTSYTGLILRKIFMKILRARLVAVPCDAFHQARTCPQADAARDTKAGGASLSEIHVTYIVHDNSVQRLAIPEMRYSLSKYIYRTS